MRALSGVRVLDLTHMLSGPYATMLLADLGAEMIKVEPPGEGEGTRRLLAQDPKNSIHGMGAYFLTLCRNKKSVTIDLKSERGRRLFYKLVEKSDVVVDNFSAGVTDRLMISHRFLREVNPKIITASITGFGQTGPEQNRVAFDMVAQAMGGGMSITGQPDGPPTRAGIPIGDLGGGLMGAIGVLSALVSRASTGVGQHVDISMLDAQISLLNYMATMYFLSGEVPTRLGNGHFVHVPYDTFAVKDGFIILAIITDQFWKSLVRVVELPELDTQENEVQPGRWKNRAEITRRLSEKLVTDTRDRWLEKMRAARIPCAPVNDFDAALSDVQVLARNMVVEVEHPEGGKVRQPGNPIKLSATTEEVFTPPPLVGQHTDEVLSQLLGLTPDALSGLRADGVI